MKSNELIFFYGTEYTEMTRQLLEKADLAAQIFQKAGKDAQIGIKINLVSESGAEEGATTHPEVVEGLIRYLQEHGFSNLCVLEGSWVGSRTRDVMQLNGIDRVCSRYDVPFYDMQKEPFHEVDSKGMKLLICDRVDTLDFLINVPVLKGHCQTMMTCALKNMKGLIPNQEKRRFHRLGLHKPIAHLAAAIHQDFILVDSICGDLMSEDGGHPVTQNRVIAALDPVLVDCYACSVVGVSPEEVGYLPMAARLGVGKMNLDAAAITVYRKAKGSKTWEMEGAAKKQRTGTGEGYRKVLSLALAAEEVDSCSACYGALIPALEMLEKDGLLGRLDQKISIGQGFKGKTGALGVGQCTRGFTHSVKGCPPSKEEIYEDLKAYILQNG